MLRQTVGHDQHRIEADAGLGEFRPSLQVPAERCEDAVPLAERDRLGGLRPVSARLELDDRERGAAACDQVDLADRAAQVGRSLAADLLARLEPAPAQERGSNA